MELIYKNLLIITAIIIFILAVIAIIFQIIENKSETEVAVPFSIISSIVIVSGIYFITDYIINIEHLKKQPWVQKENPYKIEEIQEVNDVYIMSNENEEDACYQYYIKINDAYIIQETEVSKTTINYVNEDFRIEYYEAHREFEYLQENDTYYKIYIPKENDLP